MLHQIKPAWLSAFLFMILMLSVFNQACDQLPTFEPRVDNSQWTLQALDVREKVGQHTAIALKEGTPIVAHYDEAGEALYLYEEGYSHLIAETVLESYPAYLLSTQSEQIPYEQAFNPDRATTYGTFTSIALNGDHTYVSYHNYDYTYQSELQRVIGSIDQEEQQQQIIEVMLTFLTGNTLQFYDHTKNLSATVDVAGGLYTDMELDPRGYALIAYASYIPPEFRNIARLQDPQQLQQLFNKLSQDRTTTPSEAEPVDFRFVFYPTFIRVNLETLEWDMDNPVIMESESEQDMGTSIRLKRMGPDLLVAAYVNTTTLEIHLALSQNNGNTWIPQTVPIADRSGDFLDLDGVILPDGTSRIGIVYYNITQKALYYLYTDDQGQSFSEPLAIDDPPDKDVGWYPNLVYLNDGTALFSYYFADNPRSLQFARYSPATGIEQEQIDTRSCSNGRYNRMIVDENQGKVFISYWDKCYEEDSPYALKLASRFLNKQ
jgi:hypothetical protein